MTHDELIKRLQGFEWNDVEFKKAQRDVPIDAYRTVSSFSNTAGGWLVFGVKDGDDDYEIVGVIEVDKVQNDFLSCLRTGDKLNRVVCVSESTIEHDGKTLLVFYVPEASRREKPVYLKKDIRQSFIRRGGCDEQCTLGEIERFLRDAAAERHDGQAVDLDPEHCFDADTLAWYRREFDKKNPTSKAAQSDLEFLHEWGFVVESGGNLRPTCAAILLFGDNAALRQFLPRPVLDCQWTNVPKDRVTPEQRWNDRLVAEVNLIQSWRSLVEKYLTHATTPFEIDPATMQRKDAPPDYIAFREAAINLLIHQDYADHTRKGEIRFFADRVEFWNPGDAFATVEQLMEPGEREVRNPRVVAAFRRIGLSEQAGTGVRTICHNWSGLGHVPPVIRNDKAEKAFGLALLHERLLSEEQILFQAQLGTRLNDAQAKVFAYATRTGRVTTLDAKMVTSLSGPEARAVLDHLVTQALLQPLGAANSGQFSLAQHLIGRFGLTESDQAPQEADRLVTDQPPSGEPRLVSGGTGRPEAAAARTQAAFLKQLSETQWRIVLVCEAPQPLAAIMEAVQVTHRSFFKRKHLDPLIAAGVLALRHPDNPNHPEQAYVLSEAGIALKALRLQRQEPESKA
ncbi:MAG: hypothetical protein B6D36_05370 [Planctomycetes bacterium UTPLA1]|nr:MAG: hypothetical protein B6D36_05370 [Planctomycetes bacterium UTPLA1]